MQTQGATRGPTHLVALYVATAGLQGNALGSDEEEITLLVYVLIDVQQNRVRFYGDDLSKIDRSEMIKAKEKEKRKIAATIR